MHFYNKYKNIQFNQKRTFAS